MQPSSSKFRFGAVSYLNPVPLVWGMLHGPQRPLVDLSFSIPSVCAAELERGDIEVGLVPVAEIARQSLDLVPGVGITCLGAVRSILLFSHVPWNQVRTLAADSSSRTSVQLARVILRERYGASPIITPFAPDLATMLAHADAALLIGDSALRMDFDQLSTQSPHLNYLDLGAEWFALTGLPFVFAAWSGKPGLPLRQISEITAGSYQYGKSRLSEIAELEHAARGVTKALAEHYLAHHIRYELGTREIEGLDAFLQLAGLDKVAVA